MTQRKLITGLATIGLGLTLGGCHTDMWQQPKLQPLAESSFHADGQSSRPLPMGVVARGHLRTDETFFTGFENHRLATRLPMPLTKELLLRGKERYSIYCTPCHGQLGDGNGMIAQRGFKVARPVASYHTERLRHMPIGHVYDVITNGYGAMFSYASRVEPQDRWAIAAYVRALQFSQNAPAAQLSSEDIANAKAGKSMQVQEGTKE